MSGTLNNVYSGASYALTVHTREMARLQEQTYTGSRINRASDDPSAAYQILGLNSQENSLSNYIDTLSEVISTLEISTGIVTDMVSAFAEQKVRLTQIISGIYDQDQRDRTAEEINDALEQMVLLANTKRMNQNIFGGDDTTSAP